MRSDGSDASRTFRYVFWPFPDRNALVCWAGPRWLLTGTDEFAVCFVEHPSEALEFIRANMDGFTADFDPTGGDGLCGGAGNADAVASPENLLGHIPRLAWKIGATNIVNAAQQSRQFLLIYVDGVTASTDGNFDSPRGLAGL